MNVGLGHNRVGKKGGIKAKRIVPVSLSVRQKNERLG